MARVKRSDAAKAAQQNQSVNAKTGSTGAPTPDGGSTPPRSTPTRTQETDAATDQTSAPESQPAPDPRETTIRTLQIGLTVVSLIAIGLVVALILVVSRGGSPSSPTSIPPTQATPTPTSSPTPVYFTQYVAVNPNVKPGAIVVEIHSDYQCPWCERAEEIYGQALSQLSQSGDIDLRIHIRTLIGDQVIKNDSSERAGRAALCADKVGSFWAYHSTIFANQPAEGVGYTDDQLRTDFAAQAGITGQNLTDFQTCYDTGATSSEITAMEQEGVQGGINSTPTFLVNGIQISFDLQQNNATALPISSDSLLSGLKQVTGQQ
ncbi:MAG: DsbA family protein [Propionibacteriaceae bacterium]|nr:DsbA family protein [Propionibacteriaceae bacterium]